MSKKLAIGLKDGIHINKDGLCKRHIRNENLHREDGPAVEYTNGINYWWWDGDFILGSDNSDDFNQTLLMFQRLVKLRTFR